MDLEFENKTINTIYFKIKQIEYLLETIALDEESYSQGLEYYDSALKCRSEELDRLYKWLDKIIIAEW